MTFTNDLENQIKFLICLESKALRAVKDWVLCIWKIKIEYFVCRFLGHVVLILLLDVIYENILPLTSI